MSTLYLVPFGEIPAPVLSYLQRILGERFGYRVETRDRMPLPGQSFDSARGQYHSSLILGHLRKNPPSAAEKVLGIVDADLYVPGLNFVFGEADLKGCCALISLARLRQEFYGLPADSGLFYQRMAKEAVHEIGHTLGLNHCPDVGCVMHFSNSLEDTDTKSSHLCPNCAKVLAKQTR